MPVLEIRILLGVPTRQPCHNAASYFVFIYERQERPKVGTQDMRGSEPLESTRGCMRTIFACRPADGAKERGVCV